MILARGRYIGENFDIDQVGFVPWKGTWQVVALGGPRWYFDTGYIRQVLVYGGGYSGYTKEDDYMDKGVILGYNMQFRNQWGFEINYNGGDSKDLDVRYTSHDLNINSWFRISPKWNGFLSTGYSKTYNFSREYLAFYSWFGGEFSWRITNTLQLGTSANMFVEGNPSGGAEDIIYNSRPFVSATPINNLNIRIYFDNLFFRSTDKMERAIFGFLFSYNFSPKSWIYFAINEIKDRSDQYDSIGNLRPKRLHVVDRVGVFKIKYLYYL